MTRLHAPVGRASASGAARGARNGRPPWPSSLAQNVADVSGSQPFSQATGVKWTLRVVFPRTYSEGVTFPSDSTRDPIGDQGSDLVCAQTSDPVCDQTSDPVCDQTSDLVCDQTSDPVCDQTSDSIRDQVRAPDGDQVSTRPRITLIGKPDCHLCETARAVVARVAAEAGVAWEEKSVLDSAVLMAEYAELIPVTLVDGRQHDYWRVDPDRLRAALLG